MGKPDEVDVVVDLRNWLFALESAQEMVERSWFDNRENTNREDRCWHTTFKSLKIKAKNSPKDLLNCSIKPSGDHRYPVELITVRINSFEFTPKTQYFSYLSSLWWFFW